MRDDTHHNKINTKDILFWTEDGVLVPSISTEQMREVDRIAITVFHLSLLQMMENAGRSLCKNVIEILGKTSGTVTILTGAGGNGGGGLSCARHLHNHGFHVNLILDHDQSELSKATKTQFQILKAAGLQVTSPSREQEMIHSADIVVDALIGYSLHGTPYGKTEKLIKLCNEVASKVISLDDVKLSFTTGHHEYKPPYNLTRQGDPLVQHYEPYIKISTEGKSCSILSLFAIVENNGDLPTWEETSEGWTIEVKGKDYVISVKNGMFDLTDGIREISF